MTPPAPSRSQPPSVPPVGTSVTIHSLMSRPELNGSVGIVVLPLSPTTPRLGVYLPSSRTTIALKPTNTSPVPHHTFVPPPLTHTNLTLTRAAVFDKFSFFYAFGNTPPTNVLRKTTAPAVNILLLASGDLRSALYSLVRDGAATSVVTFLANDSDAHVVARNAVLIWLAHNAPAPHVFAIWFSLGLSPSAAASLARALNALGGDDGAAEAESAGVVFYAEEDWSAVQKIVRKWRGWSTGWREVQKMRREKLESSKLMTMSGATSLREAGQVIAQASLRSLGFENEGFPNDVAETEWADYFVEGVIVPMGEVEAEARTVNSTLMQSETAYDLHYGSCPFSAFPLYASVYDAHRPMLKVCQQEFESWVGTLKARGRGVRWVFSIGDCLHLCARLVSRKFDVVATSNVADHVGLLALLQAARMVTAADGVLLTSTLLHLSYAEDVEDYLKKSLLLEPELWPGVLGWRCIGLEGSLAPESAQVQLVMPNMAGLILKAHAKKTSSERLPQSVRSEANLVWVRSMQSSVPLQVNEEVAGMIRYCRLKEEQLPFSEVFVPTGRDGKQAEFRGGMNRLHMLAILPLLCQTEGVDQLLDKEGDEELRDLLAFWQKKKNLVVATLPLTDASLRRSIELQPQLCGICQTPGGKAVLYSGLWVHFESGERFVSWLADPAKLKNSTVKIVGSIALGPALCESNDVATQLCPRPSEALVRWLRPPVGPDSVSASRSEEKEFTRIVLRFPGNMSARGKVGKRFTEPNVIAGKGCGLLKVVLKKVQSEMLDLQLCTPVAIKDLKSQFSRSLGEVTLIVPRTVYSFASVALSEFCLDDFGAWPTVRLPNSFMVTWSGMQMSDKEKYIARSRACDALPPLIALKASAMIFFQCQSNIMLTLATKDDGVVAFLINHGIRREHRYGTPAADLSICLLTVDILDDVVPWWQNLGGSEDSPLRTIFVENDEYALFQRFVKLLSKRAKDSSCWKVFPERCPVPHSMRKHFVRVLFPPLFSPEREMARELSTFNNETAEPTTESGVEGEMRLLKSKGASFVKSKQHVEAITCFQRAIVAFNRSAEEHTSATSLLASQCYLNIAFCILEPQDAATAKEAELCCDRALDLISHRGGESERILAMKAHYRKGQALELCEDLDAAAKQFAAASKLSPSNKIVRMALARVRLARTLE